MNNKLKTKMKTMTKTKTFFIAAALILVSCRKEAVEVVNPDRHYCYTYTDQFETIWTGIDQGYLFWERDTVDWDAVYERMLPVFQGFDAHGGASDAELTDAYQSMVRGLLDHHMYVQVKNLKTGNAVYADPAWDEVPNRDYYHYTFTSQQTALLSTMEGVSNYKEGGNSFPCYFAVFPGSNGKKIAYLRFLSFQVTSVVNYLSSTDLAPLRAFYGNGIVDGITNGWAGRDDVEAVIIDVRGNGGGMLNDLKPVVGSLSIADIDLGYSRTKEGLGRLDYSSWTPFIIKRPDNYLRWDRKVVALVDVNSVSCSEITALMIQSMPNGTVIGERTYGATCPLINGGHDMLYSGVFGDYGKYGYYVYTSNFDVVDKGYKSLEGEGVTPDIECLFDYNALQNGHDNQLERALQFIRTGK